MLNVILKENIFTQNNSDWIYFISFTNFEIHYVIETCFMLYHRHIESVGILIDS
jgi:hypothetical protein